MLLTTKYNVNNVVFYFDSNVIKATTIRQIIVEEYDYHYDTDNGIFYECELFATKEDAEKWKQSLEKQVKDKKLEEV